MSVVDKGSIWVAAFGAAFFVLFPLTATLERPAAHQAESLAVEAVPIELDPETPGRRHFGGLTFLSGFELRSADTRFGGLSGLALSADGQSLYAVSDGGYWLSARLQHDENGRLTGLGAWRVAPLRTPKGRVVRGQLRDAEALVRDRDGSLIVAFEHAHRLWRYPPPPAAFTAPARPLRAPAELAEAPANGGLEAVTVLSDGSLLALAEKYKNPDGSLKGWLIEKIGFAFVSYMPSNGFSPTDLATLASGDVLLLERRYNLISGPAARIRRLSRASVRAAARLQGEQITELKLPLAVDNFEGLAVREDPELGTLVYLVSDDNFSPLQRTLLLQFRLDAPGPR